MAFRPVNLYGMTGRTAPRRVFVRAGFLTNFSNLVTTVAARHWPEAHGSTAGASALRRREEKKIVWTSASELSLRDFACAVFEALSAAGCLFSGLQCQNAIPLIHDC